jgi:hypothetical protein
VPKWLKTDPRLAKEFAELKCYKIIYQSYSAGTDYSSHLLVSQTLADLKPYDRVLPLDILPDWDGRNCDGKTAKEALEKIRGQFDQAKQDVKDITSGAWSPSASIKPRSARNVLTGTLG